MRRSSSRRSSAMGAALAAAIAAVVLCCSTPSSSQAWAAMIPANGNHTIKGEINAAVNGLSSFSPTYLGGTRISKGVVTPPLEIRQRSPTSTKTVVNAADCFKGCATSTECYGATFTPATSACDIFTKTTETPCPGLVLEAVAQVGEVKAPSSVLFPWRYSRVAESCITTGPALKDGPELEIPTASVAADAALGLAFEAVATAVMPGTAVFLTPQTTVTYLGTVTNVSSPAVCAGMCVMLKKGTNVTEQPANFTGTFAENEGYYGIPLGTTPSNCVVTSYYNVAATYEVNDNQFGYVCDFYVSPPETLPPTAASIDILPQQPGGRNAVTILVLPRWLLLTKAA